MPVKAVVTFHDHTKEARKQFNDVLHDSIADVFENEIKPDAQMMSPVGDEPVRPGSKRNKDSIEVKTFFTKKGPGAKMYTTSGHGGFLEAGTKKMGAQPYMYPALQQNIHKIAEKQQQAIDDIPLKKPND